MSDIALTPRQRQTLPGRQALAAKFSTPEAKSEHYRALARRSNEGRLVLSGDEADALVGAYRLLGEIAGRVTARPPIPPKNEAAAGDESAAATWTSDVTADDALHPR